MRNPVIEEPHRPTLQPVSGRGKLVGRERELAELRHGLNAALGGHGSLFMVGGEPGIGKTALADAIGAEAVDAGALVLWGRAWDGGGAPAFYPWQRILLRLAVACDLDAAIAALGPEAASRLAQVAPDLATARGGEHPDPGNSPAARFQIFDAVTSVRARPRRRARSS